MTPLTDMQMILLSAASQRHDGNLLPLPEGVKPSGGIRRSMAMLLAKGLVEERNASDDKAKFRVEGDRRFGLFVAPSGVDAVAFKLSEASGSKAAGETAPASATITTPADASSRRPTKAATLLALLSRPEGATPVELEAATGWLAHSVRAALSGLRKKAYAVVRDERDGATCYRLR